MAWARHSMCELALTSAVYSVCGGGSVYLTVTTYLDFVLKSKVVTRIRNLPETSAGPSDEAVKVWLHFVKFAMR
jgi:hypothetical protein